MASTEVSQCKCALSLPVTTHSADSSQLSHGPPSVANQPDGSCKDACSQSPRWCFKMALEPRPVHPSSAHQNLNDTSTCTYL